MPRRSPGLPPLDRRRVIEAAIAVADDSGVAAVSMRRVAERLGVEAMSLYHHVAGKEAVLDAMVDAVVGEISPPEPGQGWRPALGRAAASARTVLARHTWALSLIESRDVGPAGLRHRDAMLGALLTSGFAPADAVHAVSVLDSYVYGFVLQERQLTSRIVDDVGSAARALLAGPDVDEHPHLRAVAEAHAGAAGAGLDEEFRLGLDLVLDGIARLRGHG